MFFAKFCLSKVKDFFSLVSCCTCEKVSKKNWVGTWLGWVTLTDQRDIPHCRISFPVHKLGELSGKGVGRAWEKDIGQRVVRKLLCITWVFFPFSYHCYNLALLHCFTLLLIIKLLSSQHKSFVLILLAIALQWVRRKIERVAARCSTSSWA